MRALRVKEVLKMNKTKRIVSVLLAAFMLIALLTTGVGAASNSYIPNGTDGKTSIPTTYSVETVIMEIEAKQQFTYYKVTGSHKVTDDEGFTYEVNDWTEITVDVGDIIEMTSPEDLFIDSKDNMYVADTKNGRILKFNREMELLGIWGGAFSDNEKVAKNGKNEKKVIVENEFVGFYDPKGVFVADFENDTIYVADTGNRRIVALNQDGSLVRIYGIPSSDLITDDDIKNNYSPAKIVKTKTGYLYVVVKESVMTLDDNNVFQGYYGQSAVAFDLELAIYRALGLQEYVDRKAKTYASFYLNISLGSDGMIYAVTQDNLGGEVKKLNSVGDNIYKNYGGVGGGSIYDSLVASFFSNQTNPLALLFAKTNLLGETFWFGERVNEDGLYTFPVFADICVNNDGIVTVLERNNGRLYQYDAEGNCLTVFGGLGASKGTFEYPESLATDSEGNIYVLDKNLNSIQIFKPTAFIKLVHKAVKQYSEGQYNAASETWKEVLKMTSTYDMAHVGLAKTEFKDGNYENAMNLYYLAQDRAGYSQAFSEWRREAFRNYFPIIIVAIAVIGFGCYWLVRGIAKTADLALSFSSEEGRKKWSPKKNLQVFVGTIRSPFKLFDSVKGANDKLMWWPPILVFALVVVVRIAYIFLVHYPLADIEPRNANVLLEIIKMLIMPITWAAASIAVTSIWDGESKFKEIFYATAMAQVPYIFVTTLLIPLSRVLCQEEFDIFSSLIQIASYWVIFLMLGSLKSLNDYPVGKTIKVAIVILIMMVLIWLVCILGITLIGQVINFFESIALEIRMMLL